MIQYYFNVILSSGCYEIYTYNEEAATILAQAEAIQNGFSYELISVTKIEKNYEVY